MTNDRTWPIRRLKYVSTINDDVFAEDTDPDHEILYIDIGNVDSNGNIHDIATYKFETAPSRARRRVINGDVIISTVRTYLEAIAPISDPPENLCVSTGFAVIRPQQELLNPGYCKYALRERSFINEVVARSTGISYPAINASDLADIVIRVPPLEIQKQIASLLDKEIARLDLLVSEKLKLLRLLAEKRRALIANAVTRGLNPDVHMRDSGIDWLGPIPTHWQAERARWLFSESCLPIEPDDQMVTCFRDGTVTLRSNRREDGFTNGVIEHGYQGIRKGQLVLHSMDAFAGAIGVSDSNGKCTPEYVICDPLTGRTDAHYFAALLREMALRRYVQAFCSAVRERAPRIRFNDFRDFLLPVPPLSEQQAIVEYIGRQARPLIRLADQTIHSLELLKERRTALIAAAILFSEETACAT